MGDTSIQRVEAQVIGPGASGNLRVRLGTRETDVPVGVVPSSLRTPNSKFVAVLRGGSMIGVEPEGVKWTQIVERIRAVFNSAWDPIGVADQAADEYDGYVDGIYSMLMDGSSDGQIARHLLRIEVDRMSLCGSSSERRAEVVRRLRALELPRLTR